MNQLKTYFGITAGFLVNSGLGFALIQLNKIEKGSQLWLKTSLFLFIVNIVLVSYLNFFSPKESGKKITYSIGASMAYSLLFLLFFVLKLNAEINLSKANLLFLLASFAIQKAALIYSILKSK